MVDPKRIVIGGGVRSGKSAFALSLARRLGVRRAFVATAEDVDADLRERIGRHRQARGADFATFEVPFELETTLRQLTGLDVVVVDCLTVWLANLLVHGVQEPVIATRVDALAALLLELPFHILIVTNEVGMGVHPETALGRTFRDVVGRAHQRLARVADEIYFAALGVILRLQPGPVALQPQEDRS
jgi:adenosylcobinamide kinase/adenosylcobinamide-phosphate guanylyltransferase